MSVAYPNAIDEMFSLFLAAWNTGTLSVLSEVPKVFWQGITEEESPDVNSYWCRVSQQTVEEVQSTLSDNEGKRRYETAGLIFVQIFCPKSDDSAMGNGRKLAVIARNAFRGKTTESKIVFRNARINELTPDDNSLRFNVVAEYEYDEIS
jgi:hypothetical protein